MHFLKKTLEELSNTKIWILFFAYSLLVSVVIQTILLPYVFPQWHAGNGLIFGGDFTTFHKLALDQSVAVNQFGWQVYKLYVSGQLVSGVASFFYVVFYPAPVSVLPWNALLHATAGLALFQILYKLSGWRVPALLGAAVFVVFPSSLRWVSQMHNENYAVVAALLYLLGWVMLREFLIDRRVRTFVSALALLISGLVLAGLVRDYLLDVYLIVSLLLGVYLIVRTARFKDLRAAGLAATVILIMLLTNYSIAENLPTFTRMLKRQTVSNIVMENGAVPVASGPQTAQTACDIRAIGWSRTPGLPLWVDDKICSLATIRARSIRAWEQGSTPIDVEVDLSSSLKMAAYASRALQIALLSPFPNQWFVDGAKAPSDFMKRIAVVEINFIYVCYGFLLAGFWKWRKNELFHMLLIFSLLFLFIYAVVTPNVGNLYRFRYPYMMPIASLGVVLMVRKRMEKHPDAPVHPGELPR